MIIDIKKLYSRKLLINMLIHLR